jgi:hypothetical protein
VRREPTEQDLKDAVQRALSVLRRPHISKPRRQRSICECGSPIQWHAKGKTGICSKCKKEHVRK